MQDIKLIKGGMGCGKTRKLVETIANLVAAGEAQPDKIMIVAHTDAEAQKIRTQVVDNLLRMNMDDKAHMMAEATAGSGDTALLDLTRRTWHLMDPVTPAGEAFGSDEEATPEGTALAANKVLSHEAFVERWRQHIKLSTYDDDLVWLHRFARRFCIDDQGNVDLDFWVPLVEQQLSLLLFGDSASWEEETEFSERMLSKAFKDENAQYETDPHTLLAAWNEVREFWLRHKEEGQRYVEMVERLYDKTGEDGWLDYTLMSRIPTSDGEKSISNEASEVLSKAINYFHSDNYLEWMRNAACSIIKIAHRTSIYYHDFLKGCGTTVPDTLLAHLLNFLRGERAKETMPGMLTHVFADNIETLRRCHLFTLMALAQMGVRSIWTQTRNAAITTDFENDSDSLFQMLSYVFSSGNVDVEHLRENRTTSPAIVELTNRVTEAAWRHIHNDQWTYTSALRPAAKEETEDDPALRYWLCDGHALTPESEVALNVARLVHERKVSPDDIAVVGRDQKMLNKVAEEMMRLGFAVAPIGMSVHDTAACDLVISMLELVYAPSDNLARARIAYITQPGRPIGTIMEMMINHHTRKDDDSEPPFLGDNYIVAGVTKSCTTLGKLPIARMVETLIIEFNLYDEVKKMNNWRLQTSVLDTLIRAAHDFEAECKALGEPASVTAFIEYICRGRVRFGGTAKGVVVATPQRARFRQYKYVVMLSLETDNLADENFFRKHVFGTSVRNDNLVTFSDGGYNSKIAINVMPWPFGCYADVPLPEVKEKLLAEPDAYLVRNRATTKAMDEMCMTLQLATDHIILALTQEEKPLEWFRGLGLTGTVETATGTDLLGLGLDFADDTATPQQYDELMDSDECNDLPLQCGTGHVTPPEGVADRDLDLLSIKGYGDILECKKVSRPIETEHEDVTDEEPFHDENGDLTPRHGNLTVDPMVLKPCLEKVFELLDQKKAEDRNEALIAVEDIIINSNLKEDLPNAESVMEVWESLCEKLTKLYGPAEKRYHSRPFCLSVQGSMMEGTMDFVWKSAKGCAVVSLCWTDSWRQDICDTDSPKYAGLVAGTMDAWCEALAQTGETILGRHVFYPMRGFLVTIGKSQLPLSEYDATAMENVDKCLNHGIKQDEIVFHTDHWDTDELLAMLSDKLGAKVFFQFTSPVIRAATPLDLPPEIPQDGDMDPKEDIGGYDDSGHFDNMDFDDDDDEPRPDNSALDDDDEFDDEDDEEFDDEEFGDDDDDDDDEMDDEEQRAAMEQMEAAMRARGMTSGVAYRTIVEGRSTQGIDIVRIGDEVTLRLPYLTSDADVDMVRHMVEFYHNLDPKMEITDNKEPMDATQAEAIFEQIKRDRLENMTYLVSGENMEHMGVNGFGREFHIKTSYLRSLYPDAADNEDLARKTFGEFIKVQWTLPRAARAEIFQLGNGKRDNHLFCKLRNKKDVFVPMCQTFILFHHDTPVYVSAEEFFDIAAGLPQFHRLDYCQMLLEKMSDEEWEDLWLTVAQKVNFHPKTYLMRWNPDLSQLNTEVMTGMMKRFPDDFALDYYIHDWHNAHVGDFIFMYRDGASSIAADQCGIIFRGDIVSKPYLGDSWTASTGARHFVDVTCRQFKTDASPRVTRRQLRREIPEFDWDNPQNSGVLLPTDVAQKLIALWQKAIEE